MNNPLEMLKAMNNPKEMVMNFMKNQFGNSVSNNLFDMVNKNDNQGLEKFVRNICKEKNIDFDKDVLPLKNQITNSNGK